MAEKIAHLALNNNHSLTQAHVLIIYQTKLPVCQIYKKVNVYVWYNFNIVSIISAIFHAFAIVGPALGYLIGGAFLNLYVDFDSVDTNR
jgi:hypothetical protein